MKSARVKSEVKMIKITKKLIREIIKLDNLTDKDYKCLWIFIGSYFYVRDNDINKLVNEALKKYNQKEVIQ